jgi:hypothetical protein
MARCKGGARVKSSMLRDFGGEIGISEGREVVVVLAVAFELNIGCCL